MKSTILRTACIAVSMALSTGATVASSASVRPALSAAMPGAGVDEVGAAERKTKKRAAKPKAKRGAGHLGHH